MIIFLNLHGYPTIFPKTLHFYFIFYLVFRGNDFVTVHVYLQHRHQAEIDWNF